MASNPYDRALLATITKARPFAERQKRLSRKHTPPFRRHALLIGEVIVAWNRTQSALSVLFASIVDPDDLEFGLAIWNSQKSDDGQRSLLRSAALAKFKSNTRTLKQILWTLDSAGKLSQGRNDATHTHVKQEKINGKWRAVPEPFTVAAFRFQRLSRVSTARLFRLLRGDLLALSWYVSVLWGRVFYQVGFGALPRRPQLLSVPLLEQAKQNPQKNPQRGAKRSPRPRSSQP